MTPPLGYVPWLAKVLTPCGTWRLISAWPRQEAGSGEAQILSSWAHHRICLYLKALDMHLPRIKEGGSLSSVLEHSMVCVAIADPREQPEDFRLLRLLRRTLREQKCPGSKGPGGVSGEGCRGQLDEGLVDFLSPLPCPWLQYCGMSLGRVGLDFRGLLPPVFESCVASLFSTALANSLDSFHLALERHKWMPMPSIPYGAKRSGTSKSDGGESLESGRDTTADSAEDLSPPQVCSPTPWVFFSSFFGCCLPEREAGPPQVLMEHMPLAVFVNGLLQAFNELRHCTPLSLGSAVAQTLQDALLAVSTAMSHFHATRGLAESEAPIFESACRVLAEVVAPYVVSDAPPSSLLPYHAAHTSRVCGQ